MIDFFTSLFNRKFIDGLPTEKFPLTHAMCSKNRYEEFKNPVLMQLQTRYGKLISVILYRVEQPDEIRVFSVEVSSDSRLNGHGTRAIAELQKENGRMYLSSLNESRVFYEKCGFLPVGDSCFRWPS